MSSDKKDLTRIEDLGEFLHQLDEEDQGGFEPPSLPEEDETSFGGEDEVPAFTEEATSEEPITEETTDFGSTDFGGTDFSTEEVTDFGGTFESTEDPFASSPEEAPAEEDTFASFGTDVEESLEASFEPEPITEPEPIFEPSPEPEPELEPEPERTLYEAPVAEEPYKAPETFSDIKQFSENSSFAGMGAEGNPSFSVLIKNVRFVEDVNDIMILLKELTLTVDSEEQMRSRLMRGNLLVPRISEFAAVLLAHKLRRFDIDILVGLSDEIHPPKHGEAPETGIVSKHNLYQNQSHHFHFDDPKLEISQIIVAATPTLEGHQVVRYLGVASEHKIIDGHLVEDETDGEVPRYYLELAQKLKAHALRAHSNAVVGLNYQLTPLPSEYGTTSAKYRLTCTGNLVWVNKL